MKQPKAWAEIQSGDLIATQSEAVRLGEDSVGAGSRVTDAAPVPSGQDSAAHSEQFWRGETRHHRGGHR